MEENDSDLWKEYKKDMGKRYRAYLQIRAPVYLFAFIVGIGYAIIVSGNFDYIYMIPISIVSVILSYSFWTRVIFPLTEEEKKRKKMEKKIKEWKKENKGW